MTWRKSRTRRKRWIKAGRPILLTGKGDPVVVRHVATWRIDSDWINENAPHLQEDFQLLTKETTNE